MHRRDAIAAEIPRLRRYARALLGDRGAADDLVQECLLRALSRQGQWRRGDSPRKWLFAILHNLHVDGARRRARLPGELPLQDATEVAEAGATTDPGAVLDIDRGLRLLPEDQRRTVLLVALEGLSYAEAAEVMGVPIGTVMSRLARGRERLRAYLEQDTVRRPPLTRVK